MRIFVCAAYLCLAACGAAKADKVATPEGFPMLGRFDFVVQKSSSALQEVRLCGEAGSCEKDEAYPCKVVRRNPSQQEALFAVTEALSTPPQVTHSYIATFTGFRRTYRDRCEVELSGLDAVRRSGLAVRTP